jgi:hypothetical protein
MRICAGIEEHIYTIRTYIRICTEKAYTKKLFATILILCLKDRLFRVVHMTTIHVSVQNQGTNIVLLQHAGGFESNVA